jgi:hypothetical protein
LADVKLLRADPRFHDLVALLRAEAVATGQTPEAAEALRGRADAIAPAAVAPAPFVDGDDLLAHGMQPGPRLGRILHAVYRAQLNERIRDRDAALTLVDRLLSETGQRQDDSSG